MKYVIVLSISSLILFANALIAQQCPKPSGLFPSNITENSATLNWSSNAAHEEYELTVKHGPKTPVFNFKIDLVGTSYSISGLHSGGTYKFRLKASCEKGKGVSQWSEFNTLGGEVVDTSGPGNSDHCPKVVNMAVLEVSDSTALLSWHSGENHDNFQVNVKSKNATPQFKFDTITLDTSILIKGLAAGGNYHFRVKAKCSNKSSGSSKWIDFVTTGGDDTTMHQCAKPKNLSILEVTSNTALIGWVHPDTSATFQVDVKSGSQTSAYSNRYTTQKLTQLIESLKPDGNYQVRVKAFCRDTATSGSSDWAAFKTLMPSDTSAPDTTGLTGDSEQQATSEILFSSEQLHKVSNQSANSLKDSRNNQQSIKVFPNPAQQQVQVEIPEKYLRKNVQVTITDLSGKIVFKQSHKDMEPGPFAINLNDIEQGYYQVTIRSGDYVDEQLIFVSK